MYSLFELRILLGYEREGLEEKAQNQSKKSDKTQNHPDLQETKHGTLRCKDGEDHPVTIQPVGPQEEQGNSEEVIHISFHGGGQEEDKGHHEVRQQEDDRYRLPVSVQAMLNIGRFLRKIPVPDEHEL